MKKLLLLAGAVFLIASHGKATIHEVLVWDGYYQFLEPESPFIVELGDTIQWLPFVNPKKFVDIGILFGDVKR